MLKCFNRLDANFEHNCSFSQLKWEKFSLVQKFFTEDFGDSFTNFSLFKWNGLAWLSWKSIIDEDYVNCAFSRGQWVLILDSEVLNSNRVNL